MYALSCHFLPQWSHSIPILWLQIPWPSNYLDWLLHCPRFLISPSPWIDLGTTYVPAYLSWELLPLFEQFLFGLGFSTVFACLQCAMYQKPSNPSCFPHGVFISMTQQTMVHIDIEFHPAFSTRGCDLSSVHKFACMYFPFSGGKTMSKLLTPPIPMSIRISDLSPHVIFQPCLCSSLDMLKRLKLCPH